LSVFTLIASGSSLTLRYSDYALSKRTDVYLSAAYQLAAGDASTRVGTGYQKIAAIADAGTASSTNRQVSVFSGLRVKF